MIIIRKRKEVFWLVNSSVSPPPDTVVELEWKEATKSDVKNVSFVFSGRAIRMEQITIYYLAIQPVRIMQLEVHGKLMTSGIIRSPLSLPISMRLQGIPIKKHF